MNVEEYSLFETGYDPKSGGRPRLRDRFIGWIDSAQKDRYTADATPAELAGENGWRRHRDTKSFKPWQKRQGSAESAPLSIALWVAIPGIRHAQPQATCRRVPILFRGRANTRARSNASSSGNAAQSNGNLPKQLRMTRRIPGSYRRGQQRR